MDGRPNRGSKATFWNFLGVAWTRRKWDLILRLKDHILTLLLCRHNLICNIQVKSAKFNPFNILQGKITFIITGDECQRVRPPCRLYSKLFLVFSRILLPSATWKSMCRIIMHIKPFELSTWVKSQHRIGYLKSFLGFLKLGVTQN